MLSDEVLDNIQILKFFHDKCTSEKSIGMMQVYRVDELAKAIETILNFIEKQQKEIKNLVDENNDILFYICNYEELRKEIIRRIENYLNERQVKKMYEVTYSMEGIIRKIMINASDAVQAQSIFTNMYGSGKVQIINIRRV